jgi:NTP pyrophosphatase (non-canonical NTP hydrolase)
VVEWQTRRSQKPLEITLRGGSTPPLGTMSKTTLNELKKQTKEVAAAMPNPNWTIHNRLVELMEEVGELANAIQTEEGFKTKKRQKSEVIDSVCDSLFELLLIADHYKIDLDKEYPAVLKQIDDRRKSGEFNHE